MTQIEYKIIKAVTTMCEEEMSALGVRGWDLVRVLIVGSRRIEYIFKRSQNPKPSLKNIPKYWEFPERFVYLRVALLARCANNISFE